MSQLLSFCCVSINCFLISSRWTLWLKEIRKRHMDELLSRFTRVWLCVTPQTAAHQAPPSLGFSRQEHWSGSPFPSPMHEWKVKVKSLSHVRLFETPWTAAYQAPPSMGFSTSHSRMSSSRWVIISLWLSRSLRPFLYSSCVYSCHLFLISSAC